MENIGQNNIWEGVSLTKRIVYFVSYAGIFNDVLSKGVLKEKLNISDGEELDVAIQELKDKDLILEGKGFIGLKSLSDKISIKPKDFKRAEELVNGHRRMLDIIAKLPIVKFIGVSGSIAAGNPVDTKEKKADLDLFIVTRNQCIWFFYLFDTFYRFFTHRKKNRGGVYLCMNHIFDESNLKIYNQNFYTANELFNLKPYYGEETYQALLAANPWISSYFPKLTFPKEASYRQNPSNFVNKCMYSFIKIFRSVKQRSLEPFREMVFEFDPTKQYNLNRKGSSYGGYQVYIQEKYPRVIKENFPEFMDEELLSRLFSDPLSVSLKASKFKISEINIDKTYESKYRTYE